MLVFYANWLQHFGKSRKTIICLPSGKFAQGVVNDQYVTNSVYSLSTFSALWTANSGDSDDTARNGSTVFAILLLVFYLYPICNNESVQNQRWKCPLKKPRGERVKFLECYSFSQKHFIYIIMELFLMHFSYKLISKIVICQTVRKLT